jgi:hypothetical protein
MTEYRSSTNSVFGDADDVILGTDESTLGNGVSTNAESITFNVANNTGLRYVFVRVNYMGSVSETISSDNTGQTTYTINQPVSTATIMTVTISYFD